MVNHNTRSVFAARLAEKHDVSRSVASALGAYSGHLEGDSKPIAFSPKEDGIAI